MKEFVLVRQIAGATMSDLAKTGVGKYLVSKDVIFLCGKGIRSHSFAACVNHLEAM